MARLGRGYPVRPHIVARRPLAYVPAAAALGAGPPGLNSLVPLYQYPTSGTMWADITATHPKYVIADVTSTGAGTSIDPVFTSAIAAARAAGCRVFGYVDTGNGSPTTATVASRVSAWGQLYQVYDIFFDEVTIDTSHLAYYATVSNNFRSSNPGRMMVFNHGLIPDQGYASLADILVVYEDIQANWGAFSPPAWMKNYAPSKFAAIITGATQAQMTTDLQQAVAKGIGQIYVTDQSGVNPYNATPAFWTAESAQSQAIPAGPALSASAVVTERASGALAAAAQLTAAGVTAKLGAAALAAGTVLTAAAAATEKASGALSAAGILHATATDTSLARAALAAAAALIVPPAGTISNSLEGFSFTATLTPGVNGNTGGKSGTYFDVVNTNNGGTVQANNTHPAHGGWGVYAATGPAAPAGTAFFGWNKQLTPTQLKTVPFRISVYLPALPPSGTTWRLITLQGPSGTCAVVNITAAGALRFADQNGNTIFTTTHTLATGQQYRVEGTLTGAPSGGGACSLQLFSPVDSATATESKTGSGLNTGGPVTSILYGLAAAVLGAGYYLDDPAASSLPGAIGPVATLSANVPLAAAPSVAAAADTRPADVSYHAPGTLTASARVTERAAAALAAAASLRAVTLVAEPDAAHLAAPASLSAQAVLSRTAAAHLVTAPALSGAAKVTEKAAGAFHGSGSLTAAARAATAAAAALRAAAALSAPPLVKVLETGALRSSPSLAAGARVTAQAKTALSAHAALSAGPLGLLAAPGRLTAGAKVTQSARATFTADPVLAAPAQVTALGAAALRAPGSLSATTALAVFSARGTLAAVGAVGSRAALSAPGSLTARSFAVRPAAAALFAHGALAGQPSVTIQAAPVMAAPGSLRAAGRASAFARAALRTSPSLSAAGLVIKLARAPFAAPAGLSATGGLLLHAGAALAAGPALAARGIVVQGTFQARGRLTASAQAGLDPGPLWTAYMKAAEAAHRAGEAAHEASASGGSDGTYGRYYQAAYETEDAMQRAYDDWLAAWKVWNQNLAPV